MGLVDNNIEVDNLNHNIYFCGRCGGGLMNTNHCWGCQHKYDLNFEIQSYCGAVSTDIIKRFNNLSLNMHDFINTSTKDNYRKMYEYQVRQGLTDGLVSILDNVFKNNEPFTDDLLYKIGKIYNLDLIFFNKLFF